MPGDKVGNGASIVMVAAGTLLTYIALSPLLDRFTQEAVVPAYPPAPARGVNR